MDVAGMFRSSIIQECSCGPALEMFDISTAYVLGKAREACFIMQLPIYAHLSFTNYFRDIYSRNKFHGEVASGIS